MTHPSKMCDDKAALAAYLYGESGEIDHQRIEEHLQTCESCRGEMEQLRGMRQHLAAWRVPDRAVSVRLAPVGGSAWPGRVVRSAAGWGLAAAAVLVLAAGAAVANLQIRYGPDGLHVTTGRAPQQAEHAAEVTAEAEGPWRDEVGALEDRLEEVRQALAGLQTGAAAASAVERRDAELIDRVRRLIEESERRQQRELALRMAEVVRDFDAQRRADLARVQAGLGQLEGRTGAEVAQQRELLNYYLMRVGQRE